MSSESQQHWSLFNQNAFLHTPDLKFWVQLLAMSTKPATSPRNYDESKKKLSQVVVENNSNSSEIHHYRPEIQREEHKTNRNKRRTRLGFSRKAVRSLFLSWSNDVWNDPCSDLVANRSCESWRIFRSSSWRVFFSSTPTRTVSLDLSKIKT